MPSCEAQPASAPFDIDSSNGVSPQSFLFQSQSVGSAGTSDDGQFGVDARTAQPVHGTPTHPITALPTEILSQVFLHCLPDLAPATFSPSSAPLLLTQICSSWRTLALSTPALWDTITLPAPSSGLATQDVRLVEVFLRRSGTRYLSIDLGLIGGVAPWEVPIAHLKNLKEVVNALLPHTSRIKVLENVTSYHLFQRLNLENLNRLEKLLVVDEDNPSPVRTPPDARFPESLQELDLCRTMLDVTKFSLPARLSKLYLREPMGMGRITVRGAVELLSKLPTLEVCWLEVTMPSDAPIPQSVGPLQRATLPRMNDLSLKWGPGVDVGPILELLDMRRLLSLCLWAHHSTTIPWAALADFAVRCHPPLATLLLNGSGVVSPRFVECLAVWSNLENLTMTNYELNSSFLHAITPKPVPDFDSDCEEDDDVELLIPFLEYLDFEWCTFPDFEAFVDLLEARGKRDDVPGNRLEYFRMATNALTVEERQRIEQCGIENIDIRRY